MDMKTNITCSPISQASLLESRAAEFETSLTAVKNSNRYKKCLFWGSINVVILGIISCDLIYTCPINFTYKHYVEYALAILLVINITYYITQILRIKYKKDQRVNEAKRILDNLRHGCDSPQKQAMYMSLNSSYLNSSVQSCLSNNSSRNDSQSFSSYSPNFSLKSGSPQAFCADKSRSHYRTAFDNVPINDEETLQKYLQEFETMENIVNTNTTMEQPYNLLNTFWNYPGNNKLTADQCLFKKCQYQLSTHTPTSSPSKQSNDKGSPLQNQDTWRSLNVDSVALTQWNANLRMWLSQTILNRLLTEFDLIDSRLSSHPGLLPAISDIKLGAVSLDRLRKAASSPAGLHVAPSLMGLIPFLEATPNQRYLVQRIKDLAKGGCMSEYRWNGGGVYDGKGGVGSGGMGGAGVGMGIDWDETLPTDAEIIMHLFSSYLDTQLMPQPNKPELKPFTSFHYIKAIDKLEVPTKSTLAIQQVSQYPPHYRVIIGEHTYEMVKGYNNLFHTILLFLYHVYKREHGVLGRIHLGKAGVNMLWIINADPI